MQLSPTPRGADLAARVTEFINTEITPREADYYAELAQSRRDGQQWQPLPLIGELQRKAREDGLWNLFLPVHDDPLVAKYGGGLSNVDYAAIAEATGRSFLAPHIFNCNAPDTGHMEVLLK